MYIPSVVYLYMYRTKMILITKMEIFIILYYPILYYIIYIILYYIILFILHFGAAPKCIHTLKSLNSNEQRLLPFKGFFF